MERLRTGANGGPPRVFCLPFRGEFGIKLSKHVPRIHAVKHDHKIVMCELGEEALYPSAAQYIVCEQNLDDNRRYEPDHDADFVKSVFDRVIVPLLVPGDTVLWPSFSGPTAYFLPTPFVERAKESVDVVLCPRLRRYGASKNWPHWLKLIDLLRAVGFRRIVAAGSPEASDRALEKVVDCAWTLSRPLDQSIAWMAGAKIVLSTDTGLAHLAVWCGRPLLLISHLDGRVAPGPVADQHGRVFYENYWPIRVDEYQSENHCNSIIEVATDTWHKPEIIAARALEICGRTISF